MDCYSNIPKNNFTDYLRKVANSERELISDYLSITSQDGSLDGNFLTYYNILTAGHENVEFDLNTEDENKLKLMTKCVRQWSDYIHKTSRSSIESKSVNEANTAIYGYTDIDARDFAKHHIANVILVASLKKNFKTKKEYEDYVKTWYLVKAYDRIGFMQGKTGRDIEIELNEKLKDITEPDIRNQQKIKYIYDNLNSSSNASQNLVSLLRELYSTQSNIIGDVAFTDSRVNSIFSKVEDGENNLDKESVLDLNNNPNFNPEGLSSDFIPNTDKDLTIYEYDSHQGLTNSHMSHIENDIKLYLSTRPIYRNYTSKTDKEINSDNPLGLTDFLSIQELTKIIYSSTGNTSYEKFIQDLERIADTKQNMKVLHEVVEDMKNNSDFGFKFHRCFSKHKIQKIEIQKTSNGIISKQTNKTIDPLYTLSNSINNNARSVAIYLTDEEINPLFDELHNYTADLSKILSDKRSNLAKKKRSEVQRILREISFKLFPSVEPIDIDRYLKNDRNINKFVNIVENTLSAYKDAQSTYLEIEGQKEGLKYNKKADREKLAELNSIDYASNLWLNSQQVAQELLDYINVPIDLDHKNIYGNLSSDVINDSWFINVLDRVTDEESLQAFALDMGLSSQSDYSNLVEHEGVNHGLFRMGADRMYHPTSYAKDFLKGYLLNGASDMERSTNASYDKMSNGDYIASTFFAFFNPAFSSTERDYATYVMRTPSDASNNFAVSLPRYKIGPESDAKSFLPIKNLASINQTVNEVVDNIFGKQVSTPQRFNSIINSPEGDNSNESTKFTKRILSEYKNEELDDAAYKGGSVLPIDAKQVVYDAVYAIKNGDSTIHYVLRGERYDSGNGRAKIRNPKFMGFVEDISSEDISNDLRSTVFSEVYKYLESNGKIKVETEVNTEHKIFQQIRNIFYQELLDQAEAISVIFDTNDDGSVKLDKNGQPIFNKEQGFHFDSTRDNTANLYDNYHVGPDGRLFKKERNARGDIEFGDGRVFSSTIFNVCDANGEVTNYGVNILKRAFNPLYGGVETTHIGTRTSDVTGRKELNLTDEQKAIIDEELVNFVQHYLDRNKEQFKQEYLRFISEKEYSDNKLNDYLINYFLTFNTYDHLFEGNTKFYKNPVDFVKRTKEYQGSGVGYAIKDLTRRTDDVRKIVPYSKLTDKTFKKVVLDANGNVDQKRSNNSYKIQQYTKFRAVTIKNSLLSNEEAVKTLSKQLRQNNIPAERVENLMSPFKHKTKVNDAQSYITLDEWVRRISARGQLSDYEELINALYDETIPITENMFDKFVQLQKNFYYDHHFNPVSKVRVSRQIKNAEFVLVPRFIKGTELEQVANALEEIGVDQLNTKETSKAANTNVLELWGEDTGVLTEENLNKFKEKASKVIEEFDYTYLYTQQETPQHVNADNKVGIQIAKKIIDNIDTTDPELLKAKRQFLDNYYGNIIGSARDLFKLLNIPMDMDGNIKIKEDNTIDGLNYKEYFRRLQEEARRQSLDSNMLDYITLIEDSIDEVIQKTDGTSNAFTVPTKMPLIMTNIVVKFESLAQSLFNNGITRQKFPGYHAPQTTNIGWQKFEKSEIKAGKTFGKRLQYHPDGKPYVEIMLPKTCFKFDRYEYQKDDKGNYIKINGKKVKLREKTDEELLKELQDAKLDEHIIYRIPTEGKQSMCIGKVVGFVDDSYGSTVIVPDDWVTQTGSDFDIDTIYAMTYHSFIDNEGKIQKYEGKETDEELYHEYVKSNLNEKDSAELDRINEDKQKLIKDRNKLVREYKNLTSKAKELLKDPNNKQKVVELKKQFDAKAEEIKKLNDEIDYLAIDYTNLGNMSPYLMDLEDYNKLPRIDRQNKNARDNNMLDAMTSILRNTKTLEENVSTSHFDDISDNSKHIVSNIERTLRENRSPYSIIDNARFQAELMTGRGLKGMSVVLDNMTSVCNNAHARLNKGVKIAYETYDREINEKGLNRDEFIKKNGYGYNYNVISKAFGIENIKPITEDEIVVTHNYLGNSKTNRNVIGNILTVDTSETTAYFLDVAKEGGLTNVNTQTLGVFKLFPMIGSDYNVALSFMYQPGMTQIVQAQIENDSIFIQGDHNPVHTAIKRLAQIIKPDLDINDYTPINSVISDLVKDSDDLFNYVFGINVDDLKLDYEEMLSNEIGGEIVINPLRLRNRINNEGEFSTSPVGGMTTEQYNAVFDLGVVLQYMYLKDIADSVANYASVLSPDSFGAKADIFSTNKVFEDIYDILDRGENEILSEITHEDGTKEVKNLLEAVYPGIATERFESEDDVEDSDALIDRDSSLRQFIQTDRRSESQYLPLYGMLRTVTGTSIVVNRMLFPTQSIQFRQIMNYTKSKFTYGRRMSQETAKDIEKYLVNSIARRSNIIKCPITYDKSTGLLVGLNSQNVDLENLYRQERTRIFGYGYAPDLSIIEEVEIDENNKTKVKRQFGVADLNNPTTEEIDAFAQLTPAQKVLFIKKSFADSLIFKYIQPNLKHFGRSKAVGRHTLTFDEENLTKESIYKLFNDAFFNSNPLFKLTALDVVKYAFCVEGFKMAINATNKTIANSVLLNTNLDQESIIDQIKYNFNNILNKPVNEYERDIERYFQSHDNLTQIVTKVVERKSDKSFEIKREKDDLIITYAIGKDYGENTKKYMSHLIKYGIASEVTQNGRPIPNSYIRLRFGKDTTLYKIVAGKMYTYLIPLNKFELNEDITADYSVNQANNKYPRVQYFEEFINDFESTAQDNTYDTFNKKYNQWQQYRQNNIYHPTTNPKGTKSVGVIDLNILMNDPVEKREHRDGGYYQVLKKIDERFKDNPNPSILYLKNLSLASKIWYNGFEGAAIYKYTGNGFDQWLVIQKINPKKINKKFFGKENLKKTINVQGEGYELSQLLTELRKTSPNGVDFIYKIYPATANDISQKINTYEDVTYEEVEETEGSATGSLGVNMMRGFRNDAGTHLNDRGGIIYNKLKAMGYTLHESSIEQNAIPFYKTVASEAKKQADKIVNDIENFIEIGDDWVPISDNRVIELIKKDQNIRDKFQKTLLAADNFIDECCEINNVNISQEIDTLQPYLQSIEESLGKVTRATARNAAFNNYMVNYLQKRSNNPVFINDLTNIVDGFYATSWMEGWLADTQESPNPIIQIVYNQVMTSYTAAVMEGKEKAKEWLDKTDSIMKKYGIENFDGIIDANGNLKPRFIDNFLKDSKSYYDAKDNAENEFGKHSFQYLQADIALSKFLLNNVEQPIVDSYYHRRINAMESINNPKFKLIYETYRKLELDLTDYRLTHDKTEADYFDKIAEYKTRMQQMLSDSIHGHVRYERNEPNAFGSNEERDLESKESVVALQNYVKAMNSLKSYYENDELATFRTTLEKHLKVINEFEMYHVNSSKEERAAALATNEAYKTAREWIDNNTVPAFKKEIEGRLRKAYKILSNGPKGTFADVMSRYYSQVNDSANGVQRINGHIDPSTVPDKIIDDLRDAMNEIYGNSVESQFNDRLLISNSYAEKTREVYTPDFYDGLRNKSKNDKEQRQKWAETVSKINAITARYWDSIGQRIKTWEIDYDTMKTLGDLMEELRSIKHNGTQEKNEELQKFYKDNVEEKINTAEYNKQLALAKQRNDPEYLKQWYRFNGEPLYNRKGKIKRNANGTIRYTVNRYIYGSIAPKFDTLVGTSTPTKNKRKQNALETVNTLTERAFTDMYRNKVAELTQPGREEEYAEWYAKNHIFNPYTHSMEPLPCWTHTVYKPILVKEENGQLKITPDKLYHSENFGPSYEQSERKIKDEYVNPNYQKDYGLFYNYKKHNRIAEEGTTEMPENGQINYNNPSYDANNFTQGEIELRDHIMKTMNELAKTYGSRKFFGRGQLPYKAKAEADLLKSIAKQAKELLGWVNVNTGSRKYMTDKELEYSRHMDNPMPFTQILTNAETAHKPKRLETDTDEQYQQKVDVWKQERVKLHQQMLDRDYRSVLTDFIQKAYRYNAVLDNQANIFLAKKALKSYEVYNQSSITGRYKRDRTVGNDENPIFKKELDENANKQFNTFIRRIVYDIWKEDHGYATKLAQMAQIGTSTKFMLGNVWGGIANVTVGEVGILAEANASKSIDWKSWGEGTAFFVPGIPDYMAHYLTGEFHTLQGHLIDLFDVVEYDQFRGLVDAEWDGSKFIKKVRNAGFTPLTSGEFFMQNRVLFSMLHSHRLRSKVPDFYDEPTIEAISEEEYISECYEKALEEILTPEEATEFNNMINDVKKNASKLKDYVEFRKNFVQQYLLIKGNIEQMKKFKEKRKDLEKKAREEFNKLPRFIDSFKLDDKNQLTLTDSSPIRSITNRKEQLMVLANFAEKVKSVNKEIHGVYDRLGQATLEKTLLGSLVTQYHKHLYPGIMKRYRRRGAFNESRKSVEKGWNFSLYDFLAIPFDKTGNIFNNEERAALEGIQNLFKNVVEFIGHIQLYYNTLPYYDQENIRRWIADWSGIIASLGVGAGVRLAIDDDDKDKAKLRGMLLYECDRLNTETFMWNPYGAAAEFKTLWSSPIAAQTTLTDMLSCMNLFSQYLFDDEFDATIRTGIHSGENKFVMRLKRNIPLYRVWDRYNYFDKSNRYFRVGDTGFGMSAVKKAIED